MTGLFELVDDIHVDLCALRLTVWLVWSTDLNTLVPIHAQPAQGVNDLVVALLGVTSGIGVLDAENKCATDTSCISPVEKGSSNQTNVRGSGWGWAKSDFDL